MNNADIKDHLRRSIFRIATGVVILSTILWIGLGIIFGGKVAPTEEAARASITKRFPALPSSASDLYYCTRSGFGHSKYFAFSTTSAEAMPLAKALAQRMSKTDKAPSFKRFPNGQIFNDAPVRYWRLGRANPLWDISTVKNGKIFEHDYFFVLVDIDKSRIYFRLISP